MDNKPAKLGAISPVVAKEEILGDKDFIYKAKSLILSKHQMSITQVKMLDFTLQQALTGRAERETLWYDTVFKVSVGDMLAGIGLKTNNYEYYRDIFTKLDAVRIRAWRENGGYYSVGVYAETDWEPDTGAFRYSFVSKFVEIAMESGMYALLDSGVNKQMDRSASLFLYQLALLYFDQGETPEMSIEEWCSYLRKNGKPVPFGVLRKEVLASAIKEVEQKAHIKLIPLGESVGNRVYSMSLGIKPTGEYYQLLRPSVKELVSIGIPERLAKELMLTYGDLAVISAVAYFRQQSRSNYAKGNKIRNPIKYLKSILEGGYAEPVKRKKGTPLPLDPAKETSAETGKQGEDDSEVSNEDRWWNGLSNKEKETVLRDGLLRLCDSDKISQREVREIEGKMKESGYKPYSLSGRQSIMAINAIQNQYKERVK